MLHIQTGLPLTENHFRSSLNLFCVLLIQSLPRSLTLFYGRHLKHTCHKYRIGAHFRGLNEHEFFDRLTTMMYASSDMLANMYGACDLDDYRSTANKMIRVYEQQPDYDEDEGMDAPDLNQDTI
jgi:hypothetical protein